MLIGVDGGGTGCRAILSDCEGNHLGAGASGPANIMTDLSRSQENIILATKNAFYDAGYSDNDYDLRKVSAVMGLAGADFGDCNEQLKAILPFNEMMVVTDAITSLEGALGSKDGAVAMIGTGTVYISRVKGDVKQYGGWGSILADQGSGAWLGKKLLQQVLLAQDGIKEHSEMTKYVFSKFNESPHEMVDFAKNAKPANFGEFAPIVVEYQGAKDAVAEYIFQEAVAHIESTLDSVLNRGDFDFCLLGGLAKTYSNLLAGKYQQKLTPPLGNAVSGAIGLAVKHYGREKVSHVG